MNLEERPLSVIVPAWNEEKVLASTLARVVAELEPRRRNWRIVVVDDGSSDGTRQVAEAAARADARVALLSHPRNLGIGGALRTAFGEVRNGLAVVLDCDLSYRPDVVTRMLEAQASTGAAVVLASPYAREGTVRNVPWLRALLSRGANALLTAVAPGSIRTFTAMVRLYDRDQFDYLPRRERNDVNLELLHEALARGLRVVELPAELAWPDRERAGRATARSLVAATLRHLGWSLRFLSLNFHRKGMAR